MKPKSKPAKPGKSTKGTAKRTCSASAFKNISLLVARLEELHQQALRDYTPLVNDIIRAGSRDVRLIEHTLDGLLDFCGNQDALELFRRLCRHYYFLSPHAAAEYVQLYWATWDPPSPQRREPGSDNPVEPRSRRISKKR